MRHGYPLVELHRHLDGNVRLATVLDLARRHGVALPADDLEGLRPYVQVSERETDLVAFLARFEWTRRVFADTDAVRRIARENVEDAAAEGIDYVELRFSPYFMAERHGLDPVAVVEAVCDGVEEALAAEAARHGAAEAVAAEAARHGVEQALAAEAARHGVEQALAAEAGEGSPNPRPGPPPRARDRPPGLPPRARLIGIISRNFGTEIGWIELEAALAGRDRGVVALDLAGDEASWPGELFVDHFRRAREGGLKTIAHAGEAAGPESVRQAVLGLGAERIGHGVRAIEDPATLDLLAERQIPLEVCPTSNLQTSTVASWAEHPLPRFLELGLRATLNTDDPSISGIDLAHEYRVAKEHLGLTEADCRTLQENAL
ncbi:MAG TPA: adenosine deaminase family protein, partial [Thermoanaerobaculia bacterium]|nr:adenosine deaminase family protein [Thermoanaerobaculia bacterium]